MRAAFRDCLFTFFVQGTVLGGRGTGGRGGERGGEAQEEEVEHCEEAQYWWGREGVLTPSTAPCTPGIKRQALKNKHKYIVDSPH